MARAQAKPLPVVRIHWNSMIKVRRRWPELKPTYCGRAVMTVHQASMQRSGRFDPLGQAGRVSVIVCRRTRGQREWIVIDFRAADFSYETKANDPLPDDVWQVCRDEDHAVAVATMWYHSGG